MHTYSFNDLKFTLKHLKHSYMFPSCSMLPQRSYMFPSYDHPQGAYIVPCKSYSLKTLSDLHRYGELVLWLPQHQLNITM